MVCTTPSASDAFGAADGAAGRYTAAAMSSTPVTLAVVGPTCTGKSALAMALARRVGGELVNADALQVYRGFDRGTAKPDAAARAAVPHHLIDLLDPREPFSAGEFARRASARDRRHHSRAGGVPIIVGGSGLYLRALWRGLAPVPPVPDDVRDALRAGSKRKAVRRSIAELRQRDPELASRLTPGDRQRVRARPRSARGDRASRSRAGSAKRAPPDRSRPSFSD